MKQATPTALVVCGLALLSVTFSLGQTGEKKPLEAEFAPKVLMIYCKDANQNAMLADVRLRRLGDRTFMVGKIMSLNGTKSAWNKAVQWVAVDEVISMFEFDSIDEAMEAHKEADSSNESAPSRKRD